MRWVSRLSISLAQLGTKTVPKHGKVYRYLYVKLDKSLFPEASGARKARLVLAPPDLSAPPITVPVRRFQESRHIVSFDVPRQYQEIVTRYARDGYVAVLSLEITETKKTGPAAAP